MDQGNLDIDNENEIGLTEDEIKEITGESDLVILDSDDPSESFDELANEEKFDQNKDYQKSSLEEIDFSDLENEIDLIDLDNEDSDKVTLDDDLDVLDDNVSDVSESELEVRHQLSQIDLSEINEDSSLKQRANTSHAASSINAASKSSSLKVSPKILSEKGQTGSRKISVKRESLQSQNSKTIKKTNNIKSSPVQAKLNSKGVKATFSKTTESKTNESLRPMELKAMGNTQQIKNLFLYLDEMLTKLPPEQIKQFALSKEYQYYLEILKKLGI